MVVGRAGSTAAAWCCRATTSPCAAARPTPPSGRRWSGPSSWRTTGGAAGAAGGRHGRRRQRQVARGHGLHLRAVPARAASGASRTCARVPVVAAALGPVAGLGALRVVASHFSVMVKGTSQLFVAGPPVVAAAMGESPDKEELGGARAADRARAPWTTRRRTRTTPSTRYAASSPTCRRTSGRRRPSGRRRRPGGPARGRAALDRAARAAQDLQGAAHPRAGDGPRLRVRDRQGLRAPARSPPWPGSAGGRSA